MKEINEKSVMLTERQKVTLGGMARCREANVGQLPKTMQELVDHWDDLADEMFAPNAPDELFDDRHLPECMWLRQLLKRPDADEVLAESIKIDTAWRATFIDGRPELTHGSTPNAGGVARDPPRSGGESADADGCQLFFYQPFACVAEE